MTAEAGPRPRVPQFARPRVVVLGKSATEVDPQPYLRAKYRLLARHLDVVLVQLGPGRRRVVEGVTILPLAAIGPKTLRSLAYYLLGPMLALREAVRRGPSAILCQSPLEAAPLLAFRAALPPGLRPRVVVEVHGDWRTATRLYGSRGRRLLTPLVDRLAAAALRRADRVRAVGDHTARLAVDAGFQGQLVSYPAWSDYEQVTRRPPAPLPEQPRVLYVGALEPTKGVDVLLDAWASVRRAVPSAQLVVVGDGSLRQRVAEMAQRPELEASVRMTGHVPREEVAGLLDEARLLVLPSRSEGLPLVLLEAMARARPVVATRVGGIPELVAEGVSGLLVQPGDAPALAAALIELLQNPSLGHDLGAAGLAAFAERDPAQAHEQGVQQLAAWVAEDPRAQRV